MVIICIFSVVIIIIISIIIIIIIIIIMAYRFPLEGARVLTQFQQSWQIEKWSHKLNFYHGIQRRYSL